MSRLCLPTFILAAVVILPGTAEGQTPQFTVYTFTADPSLRIGYPTGWTVSEMQEESVVAAAVAKSDAHDSEGYLIFFVPLMKHHPPGDSREFAELMIENLRQEMLPGLSVTRRYMHKDAPIIHVSETGVSIDDVAFRGTAWSALLEDDASKTGLFFMFYTPQRTWASWNTDAMLAGALSPAVGLAFPSDAQASPGETGTPEALRPRGGESGTIVAVHRMPDGQRVIVSVDPSSRKMSHLNQPLSVPLLSPTVSVAAGSVALPVDGAGSLIIGSWPDLTKSAFTIDMPATGSEMHVSHATMSHDGKMVAVRIKGLSMAGRVHSHDWTSGAYLGSFTAVASDVSILAFDLKDKKPKVSYVSRDMFDMESKVPLAPAFSPVHDRLAFIHYHTLMVMEGSTGRKVLEVDLRSAPPMENSGLAWSPDGKSLAYFERRESRDIDGKAQYFVTILDPERRTTRYQALPPQLRPASAGAIASPLCLDFSPDGRMVVFSAESVDPSKSSIIEWYDSIASQGSFPATDIHVVDLHTGQTSQLTSDGRTFDPVWKGR